MSSTPSPSSRLRYPARGLASEIHPMPQMNGGMAEGSVKSTANAPRNGRAVRDRRRDTAAPSADANAAAPSEVTSVFTMAPDSPESVENAAPPSAPALRRSSKATGPRAKNSTGPSQAPSPHHREAVPRALIA